MDTTWFAVDAAGHVAMFDTGENGHAPRNAEDAYYLDDLYTDRYPDRSDDWLSYEARAEASGFYLYRYSEAFEPIEAYERVVAPPNPVHIDQLPPEVRRGCKKIRFTELRFAEAIRVQPFEIGPCASWAEERVAYVASDGVTVRPIPGKEREFPDFIRRFRIEFPDDAARYRFEGNDD